MAAAERVSTPDGLRKLADAAKNKDHGVARLARQRIDAIKHRREQDAEAELVIAQLEALAAEPGPILTAVIELNRRWQALDMNGDAARLARCEIARQAIQARFEREQNEQRLRVQFERRLSAWIEGLGTAAPAAEDALAAMRTELAALREEAQGERRRSRAGAAGSGAGRASRNGNRNSRPPPARWRWCSKPSSLPQARPSTMRNCRHAGRRSTARYARRS